MRVSGDTGAAGQNLWAYTAQFGNGFSGTISLEDPANRKGGTFDASANGFLIPAAALVADSAFTQNPFGNNGAIGNGFRVPDFIANLRVDQAWGFAGISAALHDASGGYYGNDIAVNAVNAFPAGGVANGHPADRYGWALAGGAKFNLPRRRHDRLQRLLRRGRSGLLHQQQRVRGLEFQHQRGPGLDRRRRLRQRHPSRAHPDVERSRRVRAHLEPEMAHLVLRRLRQRRLRQQCHQPDPAAHSGRVGRLRRRPDRAHSERGDTVQLLPGNSCSPDFDFWEAGTRTQWNPVPQLDIGLEVLYSKRNTAFKGAAVVPASSARPPVLALDDQSVWSAMFRWQRNFYP